MDISYPTPGSFQPGPSPTKLPGFPGGPKPPSTPYPKELKEEVEGQQICYDFQKGACQRGPRCRHKHELLKKGICNAFLHGQCNRGDECRYVQCTRSIIHATIRLAVICNHLTGGYMQP